MKAMMMGRERERERNGGSNDIGQLRGGNHAKSPRILNEYVGHWLFDNNSIKT